MKHLFTVVFIALSMAGNAQDRQRCKATTKENKPCKMYAGDNGYCFVHSPNKPHCKGTTAKGKPCKQMPGKDSQYCRFHNS